MQSVLTQIQLSAIGLLYIELLVSNRKDAGINEPKLTGNIQWQVSTSLMAPPFGLAQYLQVSNSDDNFRRQNYIIH